MSKRERRRAPKPVTNPEVSAPDVAADQQTPIVPPVPAAAPTEAMAVEPTTLREKNPRRRKGTKGGKKAKGRRRRKGKKARKNPMVRWAKGAVVLGAVALTSALGYGIYRRVTAKNRVPSCGDKYRELVVTASGSTLADAYGMYASSDDFAEWKDLASRLSDQATEHWGELGRIECEATGATNCDDEDAPVAEGSIYNELQPLHTRMIRKYNNLPTAYVTFDVSGAISQAQAVIFDALCLLERADEAIIARGEQPPIVATVTPTGNQGPPAWKWIALGGAAVIAIGGVGYALGGSSPSAPARTPSLPTARASRPE